MNRSRLLAPLQTMAATAVLAGVAVSLGCHDSPRSGAEGRVAASYDKDSGRLSKIAYDANNNGVHDTWAYMDGARLIRLEADENENGRLDRWEYYPSDAAAGVKTPPERIERSTRDDGRVSRREFFESGVMVRVEEDTDGDGATDKWETYRDGALAMVALDTSGSGRPDRRLIYTPAGALDRIETDPTGSGHFQQVKQ